MGDLVVLVADADIKQAVRGLLSRSESLGIRPCEPRLQRHPMRDSGCHTGAAEMLRPLGRSYRFALVIFDHHGCGSDEPREAIEQRVEESLAASGWEQDRCKAIVIEPELEAWLWNGSPHVAEALGWGTDYRGLQRYLRRRGLWPDGAPKPLDPKSAMRLALRGAPMGTPRWTSDRFSRIARRTTLANCTDPAFVELRATLRRWFPSRS